MKKFTLLAAVAGVALAASAVESSIVGYNTVAAPTAGKYKAFAVQFENIGESARISITNLLQYSGEPKGANAIGTAADQIWKWDTAGNDWVKFFYRKKGSTVYGWCTSSGNPVTTESVGNGETFFFYRGTGAAAATLTLSGSVKALTAEYEYRNIQASTYTFMCYPWPTALAISGFDNYQGNPKGANAIGTAADQIWRWNTEANDWDKYFYRKKGSTVYGWCTTDGTPATTQSIPAGEGFFFYRGSGAASDTITFDFQ